MLCFHVVKTGIGRKTELKKFTNRPLLYVEPKLVGLLTTNQT